MCCLSRRSCDTRRWARSKTNCNTLERLRCWDGKNRNAAQAVGCRRTGEQAQRLRIKPRKARKLALGAPLLEVVKTDGTAQSALDGFSRALSAIPPALRKTFTYDQGREMSKHAQLTEQTGVAVYFCDPHSPWQRGLNENTNGLLRQYLPKGADLSVYMQEHLDAIAWSMNTRSRKSLGFKSPIEVYSEILHNMELAIKH